MTPLAQYAKDANHDNSRILFDRITGDPTGWTDTAGKAHPLPVDFQRVSAATCEQYRSYWLERTEHSCNNVTEAVRMFADGLGLTPADEVTMKREDVRAFYRDINASADKADLADEDRRDFWIQAALLTLAAVIGAAGYAATMAIVGAVVGR